MPPTSEGRHRLSTARCLLVSLRCRCSLDVMSPFVCFKNESTLQRRKTHPHPTSGLQVGSFDQFKQMYDESFGLKRGTVRFTTLCLLIAVVDQLRLHHPIRSTRMCLPRLCRRAFSTQPSPCRWRAPRIEWRSRSQMPRGCCLTERHFRPCGPSLPKKASSPCGVGSCRTMVGVVGTL